MTNEIDLVIFDCDGVLVDSEIISVEIDQKVLAELGWHLSIDEIVDRFLGTSSASFAARIEEHLGITLQPDWEEKYTPWYREAFLAKLQPVSGIEAALDGLDKQTCVASSGSHDKIRMTLGHTGLLPLFDGRIFSASEVARGKPEPDLFLHAAERMGHAPERCVVVEDSKYGARAARLAGMHVFGYAGGLTPAEWLLDEGATVFTDMTELPGLVQQLTGPDSD